ncbi:putative C1A cysteine protease [Operophtera brumata]|uniref:Putative C1A cysteine protease n=1 Tax=Operophtera brumata TaxID=104452 RepID=A0A0L7LQZ5_OPEBR|nr:putative C1A cysteine protease [Operophtera brumata]
MVQLLAFVTCAGALALAAAELNPLSDAFIDLINSKQTTWKAGRNFPEDTPYGHITRLTGVRQGDSSYQLPRVEHDAGLIASLPENFDAREHWPCCHTIGDIRDQGACGSCWAFGAVEAMTDRVCIYSDGTKGFYFSAEDLVSCSHINSFGCDGGFPDAAWEFWKSDGLVSGGNYKSNQGCRPYSIPPCEHSVRGNRMNCTGHGAKTPKCLRTCQGGYEVSYEDDKHYGKSVYNVVGEDDIMAEVYKSGPVEATFDVYDDFFCYKTGVYVHTEGGFAGRHAVKR